MAEGIATAKLRNEKITGVNRLAGDEQVMSPDQEAQHRNRQTRERHELVAENILAREVGDQFADHAHRRQHHDVNGGVRVEPEEMLEENRIAPTAGSKMPMCASRSRATSKIVMATTGCRES